MLFYLSLITIVFSAILGVKYGRINRTSLYLQGAFICFALYELSHYFIIIRKDPFWVAIFYNHFSSLLLLIGPLLYIYVRGTITDRTQLRRTDFFHFAPALIHFFGTLPWIFKPFSEKYAVGVAIVKNIDVMKSYHHNFFFTVQGAFVLRPLSIFVYLAASLYIIWKYWKAGNVNKNFHIGQYRITFRWLLALLGSLIIIGLNYIFLVIYYLDYDGSESIHLVTIIQSICGVVLVIPTLLLFIYPRVLLGLPIIRRRKEIIQEGDTENTTLLEPFKEMATHIEAVFMEDKRVYEMDFSLEDLANILDQPTHHVSYCINHVMLTRFTDLRLQYRVDYAKRLLLDNTNQAYTIESIANQAGFKTRSNFYSAFKQITGTTPTDYIKLNKTTLSVE